MSCSFLNRIRGKYRRQKGFYDKETLRYFAATWISTATPKDLLHYALFRRDLGMPLPSRWGKLIFNALPYYSADDRRNALGLLAERGPDYLSSIDKVLLLDGLRLPAVASNVSSNTSGLQGLAQIDLCQPRWRSKFGDEVRAAASSSGVAVIGNGATLFGLEAGGHIDCHGLVVRFNHFMGRPELSRDVGGRTDVWVVSPGYHGPIPETVSWVVMTGPDMRFRLGDWSNVLPLVERGVPLLTIPLSIWRSLVHVLRAPPSAGILVLAWLNSILGATWEGISIAGIGSGVTKDGRYHASLSRHRASSRHAWELEVQLVERWLQQGLSTMVCEHQECA